MTAVDLPLAERLAQVLETLGISRTHIAAYVPGDQPELLVALPTSIASLALIGSSAVLPSMTMAFDGRLLVATGEADSTAAQVQQALAEGATIEYVTLYDFDLWSDVATAYADVLTPALFDFFDQQTGRSGVTVVSLPEGEGEVVGIRYHARVRATAALVPARLRDLRLGAAHIEVGGTLPYRHAGRRPRRRHPLPGVARLWRGLPPRRPHPH